MTTETDKLIEQVEASFEEEGGVKQLAKWLLAVSADVDDDFIEPGCDEPCIDVRLRYFRGSWNTYSGDSSYDTDHRGAWGCSSVGQSLDQDGAIGIAEDLLEQVLDDIAQSDGQGIGE